MSSLHPTILVVGADKRALGAIQAMCRAQDFRVLHADSGQAAQQLLIAGPDVILIHGSMSNLSDMELFAILRNNGCTSPVIVMSEDRRESRIVQALDLGISDYIVWPCGVAELIARIRRTLRRGSRAPGPSQQAHHGGLEIDFKSRNVTVEGRVAKLTRKETELLELLVSNPGKVLTQPFILSRIWGMNTDSQYLRYYISRLRSKIEPQARPGRYIETVAGVGYRFLQSHGGACPDRP